MNVVHGVWRGMRSRAAGWASRRAAKLELRNRVAAERWLRRAASWAPVFAHVHQDHVKALRRADDRLGAAETALLYAQRFPKSPEAWVLLGEAYAGAYRPADAIAAFERALQIEERTDAAMALGTLYAQRGDYATAGARYARAYAAGAGPAALKANAKALRAAGDVAAAQQAEALWERETGKRWIGD